MSRRARRSRSRSQSRSRKKRSVRKAFPQVLAAVSAMGVGGGFLLKLLLSDDQDRPAVSRSAGRATASTKTAGKRSVANERSGQTTAAKISDDAQSALNVITQIQAQLGIKTKDEIVKKIANLKVKAGQVAQLQRTNEEDKQKLEKINKEINELRQLSSSVDFLKGSFNVDSRNKFSQFKFAKELNEFVVDLEKKVQFLNSSDKLIKTQNAKLNEQLEKIKSSAISDIAAAKKKIEAAEINARESKEQLASVVKEAEGIKKILSQNKIKLQEASEKNEKELKEFRRLEDEMNQKKKKEVAEAIRKKEKAEGELEKVQQTLADTLEKHEKQIKEKKGKFEKTLADQLQRHQREIKAKNEKLVKIKREFELEKNRLKTLGEVEEKKKIKIKENELKQTLAAQLQEHQGEIEAKKEELVKIKGQFELGKKRLEGENDKKTTEINELRNKIIQLNKEMSENESKFEELIKGFGEKKNPGTDVFSHLEKVRDNVLFERKENLRIIGVLEKKIKDFDKTKENISSAAFSQIANAQKIQQTAELALKQLQVTLSQTVAASGRELQAVRVQAENERRAKVQAQAQAAEARAALEAQERKEEAALEAQAAKAALEAQAAEAGEKKALQAQVAKQVAAAKAAVAAKEEAEKKLLKMLRLITNKVKTAKKRKAENTLITNKVKTAKKGKAENTLFPQKVPIKFVNQILQVPLEKMLDEKYMNSSRLAQNSNVKFDNLQKFKQRDMKTNFQADLDFDTKKIPKDYRFNTKMNIDNIDFDNTKLNIDKI